VIGKLKIVNFIILIFSILIIINIFFGKYNLFNLQENKYLINESVKNLNVLKSENDSFNLLHNEFKKGNNDLIKTLIKKELYYKDLDEKIIIIDEHF
tara:strand:- start:113 stop:403 length:291 start_codon:yes stop_codon:yes gene_type:complete